MTIFGVRHGDGAMMRFFATEQEAQDFVLEYSPACYHVEALSEVDFANFVLECFHNVDAVLKAPRSWCYVEDVEVCDRRQW